MRKTEDEELESIADRLGQQPYALPAGSRPKKPRGFAALSPERRSEISKKGGKAAHLPGAGGHVFTSEEARIAGSKGGKASGKRKARQADSG